MCQPLFLMRCESGQNRSVAEGVCDCLRGYVYTLDERGCTWFRCSEMGHDFVFSGSGNGLDTQGGALLAKPHPLPAIFVGGVIAGVLDLAYAIIVYSPHNPIVVPQTIASGVLGAKSYVGGARAAALGVMLHFLIAIGAATVYYLASRRFTIMVSRAVIVGLIYGALVYLFMHLVVLPLSAVVHGQMPLVYKACEFVEHWFCVGLPIALSIRRYSG